MGLNIFCGFLMVVLLSLYVNYCKGGFASDVFWSRKSRYAWIFCCFPIIWLMGSYIELPDYPNGKESMSNKEKLTIVAGLAFYTLCFLYVFLVEVYN